MTEKYYRDPVKRIWHHMRRNPHVPEWDNFEVFKKWVLIQPDWKTKTLCTGTDFYRPEDCLFAESYIAKQLLSASTVKGYYWAALNKGYQVRIKTRNVKKYHGTYATKEKAREVFIKVKSKIIQDLIHEQNDSRVVRFLNNRLTLLLAA